MTTQATSVSDKEQTAGVTSPEATPSTDAGVVSPKETTTPAQPSGDAEVQARLQKAETALGKYQTDINRLKSASQTREHELQQELERQRAEFDEKLRSVLSADALAEYETASRASRLQALERQNREATETARNAQAALDAFATFQLRGVPSEILAEALPGGVEAMAGAAWDWLFQKVSSPQTQVQPSAQTTPAPPTPTPVAPSVVTTTTDAPYEGPTWADLVKQYGSEENVWTLIETKQLSPDVIPGYRKMRDEANS